MEKQETLIANLIFTLAVLALAGVLFGLRTRQQAQSSATLKAELTYGDDSTVMEIPLEKDAVYDVDTGYYTVHIQVADGAVRFIDSPCPDHICENYGWLRQEDQSAVCMPAKAMLMIVPIN